MYRVKFLFSCICMCICLCSFSERYFVKKGGHDSNRGTSWSSPLESIFAGVYLAQEGDEVWISEGLYKEGYTIDIKEGIYVYGGFIGEEESIDERNQVAQTIIDGENSYGCVYNGGYLEGFTIQNGYNSRGGGVYNEGIIENCTITNNIAEYWGGGIDQKENASTINCKIYGNLAGSGGGGVFCVGNVLNSQIHSNSSNSGGGVYNTYYGEVKNCLIFNNEGNSSCGGVYNQGKIEASTISKNRAEKGAGICNFRRYDFEDITEIVNCIVWGNEGEDIVLDGEGLQYPQNSCFKEADGSNGTLNSAPLFANMEGESFLWDFHLNSNSPCVDTGFVLQDSSKDLDGIPRPYGWGYDMGCYEYSNQLIAVISIEDIPIFCGEQVIFHDKSLGNPIKWEWDFNADGIVDSTLQNPVFQFNEPGKHIVSLSISNGLTASTKAISVTVFQMQRVFVSKTGNDSFSGDSWNEPFLTISKAISVVDIGDEIWVAEGIYQESDTLTIPEMVTVYGGFRGEENDLSNRNQGIYYSCIDGQGQHRVVFNIGSFDGFVIQNGSNTEEGSGVYNLGEFRNSTITNCYAWQIGGGVYNFGGLVENCKIYNCESNTGGGIYNKNGVIESTSIFSNICSNIGAGAFNNGLLKNSEIYNNQGNSSSIRGGGIYNSSGGCVKNSNIYDNNIYGNGAGIYNEGLVEDCNIFSNYARYSSGGGLFNEGNVNRCSIRENKASDSGGGVYNSGSIEWSNVFLNEANSGAGINNSYKGVVNNCLIFENIAQVKGGGVSTYKGIISGCTILKNKAVTEGGGISSTNSTILNSQIYLNEALRGGGIYNSYFGIVDSCTLYQNIAETGSGIHNVEKAIVKNSISWDNQGDDILHEGLRVTFSCFKEGNFGDSNIQVDPLFWNTSGDPFNWDLGLQAGSPCIDTGTQTDGFNNDLLGNVRPFGPSSDMGAFEFTNLTPGFIADQTYGKGSLPVQFTDQSYGNIVSWYWDFNNDGITDSIQQSPAFTYPPGTYSVRLLIMDELGNQRSSVKTKYIKVAPEGETSVSAGCWTVFE